MVSQVERSQTILNVHLSTLTSFFIKNISKAMKITNGNGKPALKCGHQNLGPGIVFNKFHQLESILCLMKPDVLGISETILDEQSEALLLDMGLSVETKHDSERISVVIKDSVVYSRRLDLECEDMPAIWLEIGTGASRFIVAHLYREWQMPSTRRDVQHWTQDWRHQLVRWNKFVDIWEQVMDNDGLEVHVMGDCNMDTNKWRQLGNKHDPKVQPCVDLLYEKIFASGVVQTIQEDTRHGSSAGKVTSSCLDLHFTNRPEKITSVLVEQLSDSDHCYIQINRAGKKQFTAPLFTRRRQWGRIDWNLANQQMAEMRQNGDFQSIYRTRDVDQVVEVTTKAIQKVLDAQAKCKNINNRKNFCPFMDKQLSELIKLKKLKYKAWLANKNAVTWLDFKRAKQEAKRIQKQKKKQYITANVKEARSSKDLWRTTKTTLGWNTQSNIKQVEIDGNLVANKQEIADNFNKFFIDKIKAINDNIPATQQDPLQYTRDTVRKFNDKIPEMNFKRVQLKKIRRTIGALRNTTSTSHDDICTMAIKKLSWHVAPLLKRIIILSFETQKFPTLWKMARIVPIFKGKGGQTKLTSYRPVALLPSLSKVLESVMVEQLYAHFERNIPVAARRTLTLLSQRQHGYRSHMSCATNLLQLIDDILKDAEDGHESALLMCDLSSAFDTVNHSLLVEKLKLYGLSENAIKFIQCYLRGRSQFCDINGAKSSTRDIDVGVFQGSVAGPLLFIIFFNDIMELEDGDTLISGYADDNNYKLKLDKDKLKNQLKLKVKMEQIEQYMNSNGLKLNVEKTQLLIMNPGRKRMNDDLSLLFNGHLVEPEKNVRFLGVIISNNLRWNDYILNSEKSVLNFCYKKLRALKLMSRFCDEEQRKLLANGMIISKLTFCLSVWGNASMFLKKKIQSMLNQTYRVVKQDWTNSSRQVHISLQYLSLDGWIKYMDYMTAKTMMDFRKPVDMANKLGDQCLGVYQAVRREQWEERERRDKLEEALHGVTGVLTRALIKGKLRYTKDNSSTFHPRMSSFIPRALRVFNQVDQATSSIQLNTASWLEKKDLKLRIRDHCFQNQEYY